MEYKGTIVLETERLVLRRFTLEDAQEMFENWANDPEVTRYLTWKPHGTVEVTKEILTEWTNNYQQMNYYQWAIVVKETNDLIGSLGIVHSSEKTQTATFGWCIGQNWWGKGYMPEAGKAMLEFLFHEVGYNRIEAQYDIDNPKSGRAMEKLGMVQEGILRQHGFSNRGLIDEVWCSILREEYDAA